MYCKECQYQLEKGVLFCKNCGTSQSLRHETTVLDSNDVEVQEIEEKNALSETEIPLAEQSRIMKSHKIFHNSNETLIDSLGSGFLSSVTVQSNFSKSVVICSDKRVYQRGRLFEKNNLGNIISMKGNKCINIRDITGMGFTIEEHVSRLKWTGFFAFVAFFAIILASSNRLPRDVEPIVGMIGIGCVFLTVFTFIAYVLNKPKWFFIEYAGGCLYTNCNWYSQNSMVRFMKNISIQKDKMFS